MRKIFNYLQLLLVLLLQVLPCTPAPVQAGPISISTAPDPLPGLWEQVDDKTGKLQALIRISITTAGTYRGVVEKIIPQPGDEPNPKCDKCRDQRRDKPVQGMEIITGLKRSDEHIYAGGEILDPDEGDIYRLKITVMEQGQKLDVRGYLGIALFGRSQIWLRAKLQN